MFWHVFYSILFKYDLAESWEATISGSNCLIAKNERDMEVVRERNPAWYSSLVENGVRSIVLFPLKSGHEKHGYIWATDFDPENAPRIKEALELVTFILGAEIGNHLLLKRLQVLSARDMLTGCLNRNEMNNYVDALSNGRISPGKSVGALFADLNGLKRVNDSQGHAAGDALIRAGYRVLREVFNDDEIFRAGGDEFTVIVLGATPGDMEEKARLIGQYAAREGAVSLAVGHHVEADCRNVRTALREADESMYENKRQYYRAHPGTGRS